LINPNDRSRIQVKGYKMSDIASLERRIEVLERYVGFTLAEALAKARYIPSSLDALTDRFRFGFFVDPFTDYNYSDLANQEYYANIADDQLGPKLLETNLEFRVEDGTSGIITMPYNEFTIISQNDATDGTVDGPVEVTTVTQTTSAIIQSERSKSSNDNGSVYEEFYYVFSSLAGPVEFYITGRDNNLAVEIMQATQADGNYTTVLTSAGATAITQSDITFKGLSVLNGGRKIEHPGSINRKSYGPVGGWVEDQFKLNWLHAPNSGSYYKIRVYKGKKSGGALQSSTAGTYGFKLYYPSDIVNKQTRVVPNPANFDYNGIVHTISPSEFTIMFSAASTAYGYNSSGGYVSDAQNFNISVVGLKPNTYHKFMFNGDDNTSKCSQNRNTTTNTIGLLSDGNGILNFVFYYDAGITEAVSDVEQQNKIISSIAGAKAFTVESNDGNSTASGFIGLKFYTNIPELYALYNKGLNASQTLTMNSINDKNTSQIDSTDIITQAVNDAIESSNIRKNVREPTFNNNLVEP